MIALKTSWNYTLFRPDVRLLSSDNKMNRRTESISPVQHGIRGLVIEHEQHIAEAYVEFINLIRSDIQPPQTATSDNVETALDVLRVVKQGYDFIVLPLTLRHFNAIRIAEFTHLLGLQTRLILNSSTDAPTEHLLPLFDNFVRKPLEKDKFIQVVRLIGQPCTTRITNAAELQSLMAVLIRSRYTYGHTYQDHGRYEDFPTPNEIAERYGTLRRNSTSEWRTEINGDVRRFVQIEKVSGNVFIGGCESAGEARSISSREVEDAVKSLNSPATERRRTGIEVLCRIDSEQGSEALVDALTNADKDVRLAAALELARRKEARAIPFLVKVISSSEPIASRMAMVDLLEGFGSAAIPILASFVAGHEFENETIIECAAKALGRIGSAKAVPHLVKAMSAIYPSARKYAFEALVNIIESDSSSVDRLAVLLSYSDSVTDDGLTEAEQQHARFVSDLAYAILLRLPSAAREPVRDYSEKNAERLGASNTDDLLWALLQAQLPYISRGGR